MRSNQVVIYGASGFGREVAWLASECSEQDGRTFSVACFIDDDQGLWGQNVNGIPVMGLEDAAGRFREAYAVGGVGAPRIRQQLMERALAAGFKDVSLIHPRVERSKWIEIGPGVVICAGNILTTNIVLGAHVQINLDCTLGHDVVLGDYATLAPGVHISGCVHLGKRVYVGTGAVIINGTQAAPIVIGDDAVIGAGACVTKSVDAGVTVVGIPAKPITR